MNLKTALAPILALFSVVFVASDASAYYAPPLGRWITRDPIGYEGSQWNLYEYVGGKPTMATDPTGEDEYCGLASLDCRIGNVDVPVYGNSSRAEYILSQGGLGEGCVTLPSGIYCTMDCNKIKTEKSGDNPAASILSHEACHFCLLKDIPPSPPGRGIFGDFLNLLCYGKSAIGPPDGCVGNERPARPNW
jgi:hypothetical protein